VSIPQTLIRNMNLQPHPEGGHYVRHYESEKIIPTAQGMRAATSSISYLLAGAEYSSLHRIQSDETWAYHQGNTGIIVHELDSIRGHSARVLNQQNPIFTVQANTWFAATLQATTEAEPYALCSCIVSPGFDFRDFEMADKQALIQAYPKQQEFIASFTRDKPNVTIPTNSKSLVILTAMDFEGESLARQLNLAPLDIEPMNRYQAVCFYRALPGLDVFLMINPGCRTQVNTIGTIAAAQATTLALEYLKPDIVVSAGVAGGYAQTGAQIGDIYAATEVMLHNHHIPLQALKNFGQSIYPCTRLPNLADNVAIKLGKLSSGNQFLSMAQRNLLPAERHCDIEDMEAGAIAQVLQPLPQVDFFCLKAITNLTGVLNTQESDESNNFDNNLSVAIHSLGSVLTHLIQSFVTQSDEPSVE